MKIAAIIFVFLTVSTTNVAVGADSLRCKNIAYFCKVWGLLKYYHPKVAAGKYDWDQEFLGNVQKAGSFGSKAEANNFYLSWIKQFGQPKPNRSVNNKEKEHAGYNYDMGWINDSSYFSGEVIGLLTSVQKSVPVKKHYYARSFLGISDPHYKNEKAYADSINPSTSLKLLTLARFWNIVNYFYPYKYKTDKNWNSVLEEFIPKISQTATLEGYHLALLELLSNLNDSHTGTTLSLAKSLLSDKTVPFFTTIIENKAIVNRIINDSLCRKEGIKYGDVFMEIGHVPIEDKIKAFSKITSASNYEGLCMLYRTHLLWNGLQSPVNVVYDRDGAVAEKTLHLYPDSIVFKRGWGKSFRYGQPPYRLLGSNIGYIDLWRFKDKRSIKKALKDLRHTDALILDLRGNARISMKPVVNFFSGSRKPFVKYLLPDMSEPGKFTFKTRWHNKIGRKNKHRYTGQVAVLISRETMSFGEYFAMALKTVPNTVFVGNPTAGADGDRVPFVLPGNITVHMSGVGIFYPNGKETQRIGIQPDVFVKKSIKGVRERRDEVLERAIEVFKDRM